MTKLDLFIQQQRIKKIRPFLKPGDNVLDLGCADGALFHAFPDVHGIGLDPTLTERVSLPNAELLPGVFPDAIPPGAKFDLITMLAVLEHLPPPVQARLDLECRKALTPNGRVVITVPSPRTDMVLDVLRACRLIHGMSLEEHYGFDIRKTPDLFQSFKLILSKPFQMGLNNLFVFEALP